MVARKDEGLGSSGSNGDKKERGITDIFWRRDLIRDHFLFPKGLSVSPMFSF